MLGFQYLKTNPTQYVIQYRRGRVKRAGAGLAFYYFRAISSISLVPISSVDVPFIFNEITKDFQPITVQGQLVYRITDPKLVASLLNYTVAGPNNNYISEDPERLAQRLVNLAQAHTRAEVQAQEMRAAIHNSETISRAVMDNLSASETLSAMGVEIISFAILAIKPIPEIGRALEAEAREMLLKQADDAIYERRNSAVEQERRIKENELNTEIAVEEKNRKIQETKIAGK
ncbi:MAG: SPFH domain-containing protein, partial [Anaerolineae bacterium]|nr:SPFH domain-containing protein [Anaerolineae bacterium]